MEFESIAMAPGLPDDDKDRMYVYHYEKFMHYKNMSDCYRKMYEHCMMMAQYHYRMCMYYEEGGKMPALPVESNEMYTGGIPTPPTLKSM